MEPLPFAAALIGARQVDMAAAVAARILALGAGAPAQLAALVETAARELASLEPEPPPGSGRIVDLRV